MDTTCAHAGFPYFSCVEFQFVLVFPSVKIILKKAHLNSCQVKTFTYDVEGNHLKKFVYMWLALYTGRIKCWDLENVIYTFSLMI